MEFKMMISKINKSVIVFLSVIILIIIIYLIDTRPRYTKEKEQELIHQAFELTKTDLGKYTDAEIDIDEVSFRVVTSDYCLTNIVEGHYTDEAYGYTAVTVDLATEYVYYGYNDLYEDALKDKILEILDCNEQENHLYFYKKIEQRKMNEKNSRESEEYFLSNELMYFEEAELDRVAKSLLSGEEGYEVVVSLIGGSYNIDSVNKIMEENPGIERFENQSYLGDIKKDIFITEDISANIYEYNDIAERQATYKKYDTVETQGIKVHYLSEKIEQNNGEIIEEKYTEPTVEVGKDFLQINTDSPHYSIYSNSKEIFSKNMYYYPDENSSGKDKKEKKKLELEYDDDCETYLVIDSERRYKKSFSGPLNIHY